MSNIKLTIHTNQNVAILNDILIRAGFGGICFRVSANNIPDSDSTEGYAKMIFVRYRFDESFVMP